MKKQIITAAVAVLSIFPTLALAGPVIGLGYTNIGLSGHAGRPGIQLNAGNVYKNDVIASGSATFARGYYGFNANLGKLIPAGGVSFEPYLSLGFLNLDYNQQKVGYNTSTQSSYGYSYTQTTSYSYTQQQSIQDFYGLAGVNLSIPISNKVGIGLGGGFGHTLSAYGGNAGAVYTGDIMGGFKIAPHTTASLDVSYTHVPGASMTSYGAGLAYHF